MRKQTSVQLTESTLQQVIKLREYGYGSFTDIVRLAIDRMYMHHNEVLKLRSVNHARKPEASTDNGELPCREVKNTP